MEKRVIAIERSNCDPITKMPVISIFVVQFFPLKHNDAIIAFEDDSEWDGRVVYQPNREEKYQWCIELDYDNEREVSTDKMIARSEGASAFIPTGEKRGELKVVENLLLDGMDVETVSKYTRISREQLGKLKNSLNK